MARRTNKTAHVLNLIAGSGNEDSSDDTVDEIKEAVAETESPDDPSDSDSPKPDPLKNELFPDSSVASKASDTKKSNKRPSLEILSNDHDPLSDLVKNALEGIDDMDNQDVTLSKELTPDDTPYLNEEADYLQDADIKNVDPVEDLKDAEVCEIKPAETLLEEMKKYSNLHYHDRKDLNSMVDLDFKYVNVYEKIVQDKLLDYMRKFDMCLCDRCIIDTFALALTFLPAKIVVMDRDSICPMINYYEIKNTALISTALMRACIIVNDHPHH